MGCVLDLKTRRVSCVRSQVQVASYITASLPVREQWDAGEELMETRKCLTRNRFSIKFCVLASDGETETRSGPHERHPVKVEEKIVGNM